MSEILSLGGNNGSNPRNDSIIRLDSALALISQRKAHDSFDRKTCFECGESEQLHGPLMGDTPQSSFQNPPAGSMASRQTTYHSWISRRSLFARLVRDPLVTSASSMPFRRRTVNAWTLGKGRLRETYHRFRGDFIPIQQSEEFFTALFRQDKSVRLLRYAGEGHTISDRANVLEMWKQIEAWLAETMAPRKAP